MLEATNFTTEPVSYNEDKDGDDDDDYDAGTSASIGFKF